MGVSLPTFPSHLSHHTPPTPHSRQDARKDAPFCYALAQAELLFGVLLSLPLSRNYLFQLSRVRSNTLHTFLSSAHGASHPGLPEHCTALCFCTHQPVLLYVYMSLSSLRAEAVSDSRPHPPCQTPVLNKCLMND